MENISALAIYKSIFRLPVLASSKPAVELALLSSLGVGASLGGILANDRHHRQRWLTKGNWRLTFASLEYVPELSFIKYQVIADAGVVTTLFPFALPQYLAVGWG